MAYIVLTQAQAYEIKGNYGLYSCIEPVKIPDGNYIIPEDCLSDVDLISVKSKLETMDDNIQVILDLPEVGEECIKDRLYKYGGGLNNQATGIIKCLQTHDRTIYPPEETPALFSFFRENTETLEWIPNEWVELGWKRVYESKQYEVIQAHQTLSTWTPDVTPTLWRLVSAPSQEWTYPVAYKVNDIVTYQGLTYKCLQTHTSQVGWTPPAVPALWQLV